MDRDGYLNELRKDGTFRTPWKDIPIEDCPTDVLKSWVDCSGDLTEDAIVRLKEFGFLSQHWTEQPIPIESRGKYLEMQDQGYNVTPCLSMDGLQ